MNGNQIEDDDVEVLASAMRVSEKCELEVLTEADPLDIALA